VSSTQITHWSKLGATVKDSRQALGLSQNQLAERAQVSRSWLARVEAGHRGAELEPLLRLLDALGLKLSLTQGGAETSESRNLPSNLLDAAKARKQAWLGGKANV
jgi:y4mF family transcriptional regulator